MFLKRSTSNVRRRVSQVTTCLLQCEHLESRLAPAIHTWTGTASSLWSDAANWDGGSPAGDPAAELVFLRDAGNKTNTNDLSGLMVAAIRFPENTSGYTISGNALTLTGSEITNGMMAGLNVLACNLVLQTDLTVSSGSTRSFPLTLRGVISGDYALTTTGGGSIRLTGANTYTGGTTIRTGIVYVGNNSALGEEAFVLGGSLSPSGSITLANPYRVLPGGRFLGLAGTLTVAGPGYLEPGTTLTIYGAGISLFGGLSGEGSLSLMPFDSAGHVTLGGTNTYTGSTAIESSILRIASAHALPPRTAVTLAVAAVGFTPPRLEIGAFDVTIGSLAGNGRVILGGGSLTTGGNDASTSFMGQLNGSGSVTKVGTGTWAVRISDQIGPFTGGLTLADGTLRLESWRFAQFGPVSVEAGTLEVATDVDLPNAFANAGTVQVEPGRTLNQTAGDFANAGTVVIESEAAVRTTGTYAQGAGVTLLRGGTLAAGLVDIGEGSTLAGSGVIEASVLNAGLLDVGELAAAGYLYLAGDYTQTATGTLRLELGDFDSGNYDLLDIAGTAALDGTLDVGLLDDFLAREGDAFGVLTFGQRVGEFASWNLPDLGADFFLDPWLDDTGLTLGTSRR